MEKGLSRQCWALTKGQSIHRAQPRSFYRRKQFFNAEDNAQLRRLDKKYGRGRAEQVDESGQVVSKEEELVMKKVKMIMQQAGIIPSDEQQRQMDAED